MYHCGNIWILVQACELDLEIHVLCMSYTPYQGQQWQCHHLPFCNCTSYLSEHSFLSFHFWFEITLNSVQLYGLSDVG